MGSNAGIWGSSEGYREEAGPRPWQGAGLWMCRAGAHTPQPSSILLGEHWAANCPPPKPELGLSSVPAQGMKGRTATWEQMEAMPQVSWRTVSWSVWEAAVKDPQH